MSQVPDKVLSWLYSVLHEYRDPQRTYSDAARALSIHSTLSPRTEVYTFENGASALLLTLSGTLPVSFRGTTYRFPVRLWVPHNYPQEAPMVYVVPGQEMIVRPGQHVGVDGRVYHPYLRDWMGMWDRASVAEFLNHLSQVFAREPPVVSKAHQQQLQRPLGAGQHSGPGPAALLPHLPPKQPVDSVGLAEMPSANTPPPPPRPPKPSDESNGSLRDSHRNGPPLPPLPLFASPSSSSSKQEHMPVLRPFPTPIEGYQTGQPPGPPSLSSLPQQQTAHRSNHDRSPVSPISPVSTFQELPGSKYSRPALLPQPTPQQSYSRAPLPPTVPAYERQLPQRFSQSQLQPYQSPQLQGPQRMPRVPRQPQPDLLSDPFEVALQNPSAISPLAAPPIPPNPEKEHLLKAISTTLSHQAQQKVNQTLTAIAPLQAQQHALRTAQGYLDAEIRQLDQLDQVLSNNEAILHQSIQDCDRTIATAKSKKQPHVDDVLIAPTMVASQLWALCAEEAACREAMYVLQKAVDRGRVNGNDFVRQMRGLGRECFLKMALARKCARGMGLETES